MIRPFWVLVITRFTFDAFALLFWIVGILFSGLLTCFFWWCFAGGLMRQVFVVLHVCVCFVG